MKKIIATVLAMVMALALCTTAFAATALDSSKHILDENATASAIGNVTVDGYWLGTTATLNNTGKVIVAKVATGHDTYWYAVKSADDDTDIGVYYVWDKDVSKFAQITKDQKDIIDAGYNKTDKLILKESAAAATCTDDGSLFNVYTTSADQSKYVKAADVKAYNDKQTKAEDKVSTDGLTVVYFGASYDVAVKYYDVTNSGSTYALKGGHILVKDGTTFGAAKVDVYKCALCGNRYIATYVTEAASLKSEYYTNDAANVSSYASANGILLKNMLNNDATLYLVEAGKTTGTTTGGNTTSPKTFDAGIAMYVGMALTSVAGSAVVIGKKKEF